MQNESSNHGSISILGIPFLMTYRTKIDVHVGTLSMDFSDDVVHFNIFVVMRHPAEEHFVFLVDIIVVAVDSVDTCADLLLDFFDFDLGSFNYVCDSLVVCSICVEIASAIHSNCVAFTIQPASLELKPLPEYLK